MKSRALVAGILLAVSLGVFYTKSYAQELSFGFGFSIQNQTDHLEAGGGFNGSLSYKPGRYPFVFRLAFKQYWSLATPGRFSSDQLMSGYSIDPSILFRLDLSSVVQTYVGLGFGINGFPRETILENETVKIVDKLDNVNQVAFMVGTYLKLTQRVALNFDFRYSSLEPELIKKITILSSGESSVSNEKLKIDSLLISVGVRIHILLPKEL